MPATGSVLDDIVAGVREDLARREAALPLPELLAHLADAPAPRDPMPHFRARGSSVIAEVKRRSPSKGDLADIPDPAALARRTPAEAPRRSRSSPRSDASAAASPTCAAVRAAVETPILRKDFIVETYQLVEARAAGADLALLIVAALDDDTLRRLHDEAGELGLTVLVEVHDEAEAERALALDAELIGVNSRNLKTLEVDPDVFGRLAPQIHADVVKVAESGITGVADVQRFVSEGAGVVLVGEALVKDGDPEAAVRAMTGVTAP